MSGDLCRCGAAKARPSNIACNACFARLPEDLRKEFVSAAMKRRGAPSYWSALRKVETALRAMVPAPVTGGAS